MLALALLAALFEFHSPFWLDLHHRLYPESAPCCSPHDPPLTAIAEQRKSLTNRAGGSSSRGAGGSSG
jgi:hypothetical protein